MSSGRATPGPPEWRVTRVATTGSTNADLVRLAAGGAPFGSVLVADHQSAGKGRLGRTWDAPPGASLLVSILLPPDLGGGVLHRLTQATGLAAVDACERAAGVRPTLKWPNDLVVGQRKLAGILAETVLRRGEVVGVVIGMGVNVNWPPDLPAELAGVMTALNHEAGHDVDRDALLDALLDGLAATDWDTLADRYREHLGTLGQRVRVDLGTVDVVGTAVDVTTAGELVVEADGGSRHVVAAGDVVHLRPVPGAEPA